MGYQALLFCPDEKLARVVSQVFGELEFAVDPINEPFAAVKKLMAQHYDAVVVDCNEEQNTSLLFKSARNSTVNQNSLAIALVEGQAGVAKAYRIGANLVLTKPINVEQAKGTLRVARGLLRKSADAATVAGHTAPAPTAMTAPTPAASSIQPTHRTAEPVAPPHRYTEVPEFEKPLPAMAALAKVEEKPATAPAPTAQTSTPSAAQAPPETALLAADLVRSEAAKAEEFKPATAPTRDLNTASSPQGAAAPAPAKEAVAPAGKETSRENAKVTANPEELAEIPHSSPSEADFSTPAMNHADGPSFAALSGEDSADSGGSKKLVIAAVIVVALATTVYFGWTKSGQSQPNATSQPAASTQQMSSAPVPELAPARAPGPASATSSATAPKPSATQSDQLSAATSPGTRLTISSEPETKKPAPAPIQVKPAAPGAKSVAQQGESAAQLPSPLAVASSGDTGLGGLLSSPPSVSTPVLARVRISQGVSQGLLIKRVQPKYPAMALASHTHGAVQIEATIDKQGKVVSPKVLSGDPMLAAAALEAVRQWRYKPYYLDGAPVEIETQITINFTAN